MDPDQNLKEQRDLAEQIIDIIEASNGAVAPLSIEEIRDLAYRLADRVQALDGWLTRRGFLPAAWAVR